MKRCKECLVEKSLDEYYPHRSTRDRRRPHCKECQRTIGKTERLMHRYGITEAARSALAESQGYRCAICRADAPLVVDHDHKTGQVRGLLCGACNPALGSFRDDVEILKAAIVYLKKEK